MLSADKTICPPARPSFSLALDRAMRQVEYHCFAALRTGYIDPLYKEMCLVISEVYIMNPDAVVKVNGTEMTVGLVQEVYYMLRNNHLRMILANFQSATTRVFNKRAYLRTALYNAVFELESNYVHGAGGG